MNLSGDTDEEKSHSPALDVVSTTSVPDEEEIEVKTKLSPLETKLVEMVMNFNISIVDASQRYFNHSNRIY